MFSLIIQTALLIAIAFILGAIIGCMLRNLFGSAEADSPSASLGAGAAGAVGAAGLTAARTVTPEAPQAAKAPQAPIVPKPPVPSAPERPAEKAEIAKPAAPLAAPARAAPPSKPKPSAAKPKATPKPKVVAKVAPTPKAKRAPAKRAAPGAGSGQPDNLKLIRGIGPQNEGRLNSLGVKRFVQIAAWSKKDEAHFGDVLAFPGRIEREDWVGQAKVLAKGGQTDFAKRVKSGDVGSSVGEAKAGEMGKKPTGMLKAARSGKADDLTLIDGVGSAIESKMNKLGIHHFDQIAKMSRPELVWLGNAVGFPGRPERENWAGESKTLAAGGGAGKAKPAARGQIKGRRSS